MGDPVAVPGALSVADGGRRRGDRLAVREPVHHGYYDGAEREFRGFGRVDQWDTESVPGVDTAHLPPVCTRTWFHTGAWTQQRTLTAAYAAEYTRADPAAARLPEPTVPTGLSPQEVREAHRALKGRVLRQEVYGEDGAGALARLYAVTEHTYAVVALAPDSFRVDATESRSASYDLDLAAGTPDPRVAHTLSWGFDSYGFPTHTAAVAYARRADPGR